MEDQIKEDLKKAQLERDELKVSTLRMLLSEIKYSTINKGTDTPLEEEILVVLRKELKKRSEAADSFKKGGREEQAQKEEAEAKILEGYLPDQISTEELTKIVEGAINELEAKSIADMGKVIGAVMLKVKGGADGGKVSALVRERLT
jgi:uncharacterized protein